MALPIERFKNGYANWRYNPFDDTSLDVDKNEDNLYIPASSPFVIQLLEQAKKTAPSTVVVWCYDTSTYFTEVATPPAQSQFRVDYPPTDGKGTGLIEFNQNDGGKQVKITYKATGSPIVAEFLDTKISWPDGSPADRQIAAYISSLQKFAWRNNPLRYFHERDVVYNTGGENESCMLFRFKKAAAEGKVLLELKGAKLHQAYYSELAWHCHDHGSLTQPAHTHGPGNLSGTQPLHAHQYPYSAPDGGWATTQNAGDDAVTVNGGVTGSSGDGGITGWTEWAGGNAKTYPNALKVYIDGVDKTAQILALCGLGALGDGTAGHVFVTTGTGEMDITSLITSDGFHEIKITEPQNAGGRCLLHMEVY